MTKKELSQLVWLKREIERDKERLRELEARAEGLGAPLTGAPGGGGASDTVGRYAAEAADVCRAIDGKVRRCWTELQRLTRYIDAVEDSLMRQILTARYIEGKTWNQVADSIGGGNTEDSVRMLHNRYLRSR